MTLINPNIALMRRNRELPPTMRPGAVVAAQPPLKTLAPRTGGGGAVRMPPYDSKEIDLTTERTLAAPLVLDIQGTFLVCNFSTYDADRARVRFNRSGAWATIGPGWQMVSRKGGFDVVEVANVAQSGSTMELLYGNDPDASLAFRYR